IIAMCLWSMRSRCHCSALWSVAADVRGDALTVVQNLDGRRCRSDLDRMIHERMRHAVKAALVLNVIVDIDACVFPLSNLVWQHRQGLHRWAINRLEERAATAFTFGEFSIVELFEQLGDRLIQLSEREESAIAKPCDDPTLGDLHTDFDFCFVSWLPWSRGD